MIEQLIFYTFAAVMVFAAGAVITVRNPVYAALFLVLCFFSSACIWMLLEAEFLAITLVLVYVGAVMVLFLFVVMMIDVNVAPIKEGFARYLPVGLLVATVMLLEMLMVAGAKGVQGSHLQDSPPPHPLGYSNTEELGKLLYTEYVYAFEIAAVVLLVAIIAAIALTMRKRPQTRYQNPSRQVSVKKTDRLRIVATRAEREEGQS